MALRSHFRLVTVLLGMFLLGSATACLAKVEFIGVLNGERVYLIWGGECSALDPPTDNVARVELTYTGPPQPGVFSNIVLIPPFDSFDTDGESYLHVFASTPMPMPCTTCYQAFVQFDTVLPLEEPGAAAPIDYEEFNDLEGSCSGTAHRSDSINVPALHVWAQILMALALGLVAMTALTSGGPSLRRVNRAYRV